MFLLALFVAPSRLIAPNALTSKSFLAPFGRFQSVDVGVTEMEEELKAKWHPGELDSIASDWRCLQAFQAIIAVNGQSGRSAAW
jgi:hypothetical protein